MTSNRLVDDQEVPLANQSKEVCPASHIPSAISVRDVSISDCLSTESPDFDFAGCDPTFAAAMNATSAWSVTATVALTATEIAASKKA